MNVYSNIMAALFARTQLLNATIPVVFQLKKYNPINGGREPYVRVNLYRNRPQRLTMGQGNVSLFQGILQLSITHNPDSVDWFKSEPEYIAIGEQIAAHFPADLILWNGSTKVQISQLPELGPIFSQPSQVTLPVSIYWQADQ